MQIGKFQGQKIANRFLSPASIICLGFLSKCLVLFFLPTQNLFEKDSFRYLNLSRDFFENYFSQSASLAAFDTSPGYPFILYLLGNFTPKQIVLTQFLILAISQFLLFRILIKHFSYNYSVCGLFLFTLESSTNTSSFKILSESWLLFLLIFLLYVISKDSSSFLIKLLSGFALGMAILVKPIAQFIFCTLVIAALCNFNQIRRLLPATLACLAILVSWLSFNYAKYEVPQVSGIQSYNLLYYEGSGAKSFRSGSPLMEVQANEFDLEHEFSMVNTDVAKIVNYREEQGFSLIFQNFSGFLEMHVVGIFKILFGPGSATISQITGHFPFSNLSKIIFEIASLFSSSLQALGSAIALLFVFPRTFKERRFLLFLAAFSFVVLLIISSGANAYSRFRVPLVPFEIILLGYTYEAILIKVHSRASNRKS